MRKVSALIKNNKLFLITVILPTTLAIIYWGFIASDVYVSESHFILRSPQQQAATGLGALLQGAGFSQAERDIFTVKDFIGSRDALTQLNSQLHLAQVYGNDGVDFANQFGGPVWRDNDFEALERYFEKKINVDIDSSSSIGTLTVEAFSSEDAYRINKLLLEMSEKLVNRLNERAGADTVSFATEEVAQAEAKAKVAELALSEFRNQKGVFDPERQSALQLEQISKLQDDLVSAKTRLAEIRSVSKDNPQIPVLQQGIESLKAEINTASSKITGNGQSLSGKSAEYERLVLERDFAGKEFAAALTFLDQARNEAQRQQLYLERIVQPDRPVSAKPRRLRNVVATFMTGLLVWGILSILIAGVREHKD